MERREDQHPMVESNAVHKAGRLIWWSDRIVLYGLLLPTMLIVSYNAGGALGLPVGLVAAFAVWLVYAAARSTLIAVGALLYCRLYCDREVISICNDALDTGDEELAFHRLHELITRTGETYVRLVALADYAVSTKRFEPARKAIERAKELARSHESWQIGLVEAAYLRQQGCLMDADSLTLRLVEEQPYSFDVRIQRSEVLAELGRAEEARGELDEAQRLIGFLTLRLVQSRRHRVSALKRVRDAEHLISRGNVGTA